MNERAKELFKNYSGDDIKRFREWHQKNPHIYKLFKEKSQRMKRTGRRKYSARTIFESMRWDQDVITSGNEFKISNDFIPMFVRLLVYHHEEFEEFFNLKNKGEDNDNDAASENDL